MGVAFIWESRRRDKLSIPDTIPEAVLEDTPVPTVTTD
jgi:hypothetical protein